MIGSLRFIGVSTAAVWLGGAVFFTVGILPATHSAEVTTLLQGKTYFLDSIEQTWRAQYFHFLLICGIVALLQLSAEWLYLGRPSRKFSFGLLIALTSFALIGGTWLQPRLRTFNETRYSSISISSREAAAKSYRVWRTVFSVVNVLMISGLILHFWRLNNPSDTSRFRSSVKFRG